jgi:hypothetical protein
MEMPSGINMGAFSEKQGAVRNKLMSFHSDMSDFGHKHMDSCGEMMVSSGIKTRVSMVMKKSSWRRGFT